MYLNDDSIGCCGIKELDGVENTKNVSEELLRVIDDNEWFDEGEYHGPAFIFFSTTGENKKGDEIMDFIQKNKLGEVKKMRSRKNPNSGSTLYMFCWGVNKKNSHLFWVKNRKGGSELEDEDNY